MRLDCPAAFAPFCDTVATLTVRAGRGAAAQTRRILVALSEPDPAAADILGMQTGIQISRVAQCLQASLAGIGNVTPGSTLAVGKDRYTIQRVQTIRGIVHLQLTAKEGASG